MGDRSWTAISFSGNITADQAEDLLFEIAAQGCKCDDGDDGGITVEHLKLDTCFYDEECNYALMDGIESWCKENHVSYLKTWSPGGGYGEGAELYIAIPGATIAMPQCEGEACLTAGNLKELRDKGATLDDVIRYVDQVERFREHHPPLVVQ